MHMYTSVFQHSFNDNARNTFHCPNARSSPPAFSSAVDVSAFSFYYTTLV